MAPCRAQQTTRRRAAVGLTPALACRQVSMNVGFYYMSNAMGRLTGTIVSGALYSFGGGLYEYLLPSGDACAGALYQTAQGDACIIPDFTKGFG